MPRMQYGVWMERKYLSRRSDISLRDDLLCLITISLEHMLMLKLAYNLAGIHFTLIKITCILHMYNIGTEQYFFPHFFFLHFA